MKVKFGIVCVVAVIEMNDDEVVVTEAHHGVILAGRETNAQREN